MKGYVGIGGMSAPVITVIVCDLSRPSVADMNVSVGDLLSKRGLRDGGGGVLSEHNALSKKEAALEAKGKSYSLAAIRRRREAAERARAES